MPLFPFGRRQPLCAGPTPSQTPAAVAPGLLAPPKTGHRVVGCELAKKFKEQTPTPKLILLVLSLQLGSNATLGQGGLGDSVMGRRIREQAGSLVTLEDWGQEWAVPRERSQFEKESVREGRRTLFIVLSGRAAPQLPTRLQSSPQPNAFTPSVTPRDAMCSESRSHTPQQMLSQHSLSRPYPRPQQTGSTAHGMATAEELRATQPPGGVHSKPR